MDDNPTRRSWSYLHLAIVPSEVLLHQAEAHVDGARLIYRFRHEGSVGSCLEGVDKERIFGQTQNIFNETVNGGRGVGSILPWL